MIRVVLALAALLPLAAEAQPVSRQSITENEPTAKHCVLFLVLTIQDGSKIEGPWSFGPIMRGTDPSYPSPIVVAEGAALPGPLKLTLCDGKLWISRP